VGQSGGADLLSLVFLAAPIVLMLFFMTRSERKKQAEQQAMLGGLKRGDEVVLTSGFFGKIHALDERTITLEIGDKQRVRVLKQAVMGPAARFLLSPAEAKALEAKGDKAEKKGDAKDEKKDVDALKAEKTA